MPRCALIAIAMRPIHTHYPCANPLAARRLQWGEAALQAGEAREAAELFAQALELAPDWPPALFLLGKALMATEARHDARIALQRVVALDSADTLGASVLLAQMGAPPVMPDAYIAALFDEYAPRFEAHLSKTLGYCAPSMLAAALAPHAPFARAVDLGCGTGLMGKALGEQVQHLSGCDLSARMIDQARASGLYAALQTLGIDAFMATLPDASLDLVVAADVFCYLPDLQAVFAHCARVLKPGGVFAFTIQRLEPDAPPEGLSPDGLLVDAASPDAPSPDAQPFSPDASPKAALPLYPDFRAPFKIGADCRVHHSADYLAQLQTQHAFERLFLHHAHTRLDAGKPVPGSLYGLCKGHLPR